MTDTSTPQMGPNVRRFVRSAWLLLFAQLIAALFAIGATGWAAFYVADLRAERDALRAQVEEFMGGTTAEPVYRDPGVSEVELVDDPLATDEPEIVEEEPETPPPPQTSPATVERTPDRPTRRPPATSNPVVRPPTRTPTRAPTRTPVPRPEAARDEERTPPRRNNTYPGGLPGENGNAEPPFVPGRFNPDAPSSRTPVIPDVDLNDLPIDRDPQRGPNDQVRDPVTRGNQNPDILRFR